MFCSNCEIDAQSTVQCPELCTPRRDVFDEDFRAAIPLHHEYLDREHTDVIQRVGDLSRYPASPKDGRRIMQAKRIERDCPYPDC
jgi:hypothetical protein